MTAAMTSINTYNSALVLVMMSIACANLLLPMFHIVNCLMSSCVAVSCHDLSLPLPSSSSGCSAEWPSSP